MGFRNLITEPKPDRMHDLTSRTLLVLACLLGAPAATSASPPESGSGPMQGHQIGDSGRDASIWPALTPWALTLAGILTLTTLLLVRARGREARLESAMREAETAAQEATAGEHARAEREHFGKDLALALQGQETLEAFGTSLLERLCRRLDAKAGVFHHADASTGDYRLTASYATGTSPAFVERYAPGQGLAGQVVVDRKILICAGQATDWPRVISGTQASAAVTLVIAPIVTGQQVSGVVELALMQAADANRAAEIEALLEEVLPVVALSLDVLLAKLRTLEDFDRYRAMEEFQGRILASISDGLVGEDTQGRVTFVNAAALRMLGFEESDLLGQPWHALTHHQYPDGRVLPRDECPGHLCMQDGRSLTVSDQVFWRKDGTPLAVEYTASPVLQDGVAIGALMSFRDIGERLEAQRELARRERQLAESEAKLRTIFETSSEGIWVIDTAARTTDLNPAMANILGLSREAVLGRTVFEFLDPANRAILSEQMQRRQHGETGTYEIAFSRPDGSQVQCQMHATPLFDAQGKRVGSFAMVTDLG